MGYRRFIWLGFGTLMVLLAVTFAYSYVVDPFGVNRSVQKDGWNKQKPEFYLNTRKWKVFNCVSQRPSTVFLGSSRVEYLAPERLFDNPSEVYNLGLSGGTTAEMLRLAELAVEEIGVKQLYFGVDFYAVTNHNPRYRTGFEKELTKGGVQLFVEQWKSYLSFYSLDKSLQCVKANKMDPLGHKVRYQYNMHGSRTNAWRELNLAEKGEGWLQEEFEGQLKTYDGIYNGDTARLDQKALAQLLLLSKYCEENNVALVLFVPPIHCQQLQLLLGSRMRTSYFTFLRFMAKVDNYKYFGGCNEFTSNQNLYWDSQHARKGMYDLIHPVLVEGEKGSGTFGFHVDQRSCETLIDKLSKE